MLNIWFGYGISGVAASAAIVAIFPVIANTVDGLRAVEPKLLELFHLWGVATPAVAVFGVSRSHAPDIYRT